MTANLRTMFEMVRGLRVVDDSLGGPQVSLSPQQAPSSNNSPLVELCPSSHTTRTSVRVSTPHHLDHCLSTICHATQDNTLTSPVGIPMIHSQPEHRSFNRPNYVSHRHFGVMIGAYLQTRMQQMSFTLNYGASRANLVQSWTTVFFLHRLDLAVSLPNYPYNYPVSNLACKFRRSIAIKQFEM